MKVLVHSGGYVGNGAGTILLALLAEWRRRGWSIDVLHGHPLPPALTALGVGAVTQATGAYDFALMNTVASIDRFHHIDPDVPILLWLHEARTALLTQKWTPLDWCNVFSRADHLVFQTEWQARTVFGSILDNLPAHRVSVIANGLPAIEPATTPAAEKPDGRKRIVFLGSVYARKRPQDLIDAVLQLDRVDVECLFIGNLARRDSLGAEHNRLLDEHPTKFRLLGLLDRAASLEYLRTADVFCLPSEDESQPISILEAAQLGVPMALSDLPPYAGIWTHGSNCLLAPVKNSRLLAWNLRMLLDDPVLATQLVAQARATATRFPIKAFIHRFDAAIDDMLATTQRKASVQPRTSWRNHWA